MFFLRIGLMSFFKLTVIDKALCKSGIRFSSARNHSPAFAEGNYLALMFGDVGQAVTKAWVFTNADMLF